MAFYIKFSLDELDLTETNEVDSNTGMVNAFVDLLHPTISLVIYPTIAILYNRTEMLQYVKSMF